LDKEEVTCQQEKDDKNSDIPCKGQLLFDQLGRGIHTGLCYLPERVLLLKMTSIHTFLDDTRSIINRDGGVEVLSY